MVRPHKYRFIAAEPQATLFKPAGVPVRTLDVLTLRLDELEALRLADVEGLYHVAAAERMGVSRATFGRLLASGRKTVARALTEGKALACNGGAVALATACPRCGQHCPRRGRRCSHCPPKRSFAATIQTEGSVQAETSNQVMSCSTRAQGGNLDEDRNRE